MLTHYDHADDHVLLPDDVIEPDEINRGPLEPVIEFDPARPF